MTIVKTVSGKSRRATASEQALIDYKKVLKNRKKQLESLRNRVNKLTTTIDCKVSDIESDFDLYGDKFKSLHVGIKEDLESSSNKLSDYVRDAQEALNEAIVKINESIDSVHIPTFYPDLEA